MVCFLFQYFERINCQDQKRILLNLIYIQIMV
ncbi:hypothetical protein Xszus_00103 [Xenorhabdus szentirmaii]|nr:hypothetical protein Xsze_03926 [Xenorhabdus szentirmaii DSM 16338]PHM40444.1 hypothetical protein Xszus_00103 [Xenorhabdus szentirmaii]